MLTSYYHRLLFEKPGLWCSHAIILLKLYACHRVTAHCSLLTSALMMQLHTCCLGGLLWAPSRCGGDGPAHQSHAVSLIRRGVESQIMLHGDKKLSHALAMPFTGC